MLLYGDCTTLVGTGFQKGVCFVKSALLNFLGIDIWPLLLSFSSRERKLSLFTEFSAEWSSCPHSYIAFQSFTPFMTRKVISIFWPKRVCWSRDAYLILINKVGSIKKITTRTVMWRSTISNRCCFVLYPNLCWWVAFLSKHLTLVSG